MKPSLKLLKNSAIAIALAVHLVKSLSQNKEDWKRIILMTIRETAIPKP
ncbi:hypothetical protein H6G96_11840 [Nostoc sp. FACHB-892]|nr:hypothetical protein [Nostoc sp. FACHB-892]MBD2726999.1 hypothetical protein [Nostoc sp. FACHB-892]